MNRQAVLVLGASLSMMAATLSFTGTATPDDWPTRWTVNGNGMMGAMDLSIRDDGSLTGRLMDQTVEGYVTGRHLVIRRSVDGRVEVWEGWLGQPRPGGETAGTSGTDLILAGTIAVDEAGQTQIYPWFGTPVAASGPSSPVADGAPAAVAAAAAAEIAPAAATPAASPAETLAVSEASATASDETAPTPAAPVPAARAGGPLSGFWSGPGGRFELLQDGNQLKVTLPDGSTHSGRMTGEDTLVVGLRKGCCNGKLEGPDVIAWSDGARWTRTD